MKKKKLSKKIMSVIICGIFLFPNTPKPVKADIVTAVTSVSAGGYNTAALRKDGTVVCWGYNYNGQLGNGNTTDSNVPVKVTELTGVKAVSAGELHTTVLKDDGTVWSWGHNNYGELGNGNTTESHVPVQVIGLTGVKAVDTGIYHTVAIKDDGTVWSWGSNGCGQLGNGNTTGSSVPVQVIGLTGVKAVSAGNAYTVAIKDDGTVWSWGRNSYGQLGNGNTTNSNVPVQVMGLTGVKAVSTGDLNTVAIRDDGTVWSWGNNQYGQLGNGNTTDSHVPVQVIGLTGAKSVGAGNDYTTVLKDDGTVWSWGRNDSGQLGNGTNNNTSIPVQTQLLTNDEAVNTDKGALEVSYAAGDNENSVTQNVILKASGQNGTSISWSSDNAAVTAKGIVTRPDYFAGNTVVNLIAQITKGNVVDYKTYKLTVIKNAMTDKESVDTEKEALVVSYAAGDNENSVTQNVILKASGQNGTSISWDTDNAAVTATGIVTRPDYFAGNMVVNLLAKITKGNIVEYKTYNLTVIKNAITDQESVDTDKGALVVSYAAGDNENSVTQNVSLPTSGHNGTSISWSSDNAAVTAEGVVTRPEYKDGDKKVTLSALVTKGNVSEKVTYTLVVKAMSKASDAVIKSSLPKTGYPLDFQSLGMGGLVLMVIGMFLTKMKK